MFFILIFSTFLSIPSLALGFMDKVHSSNTAGCVEKVFEDEINGIANPYISVYEAHKKISDRKVPIWARHANDFLKPSSGVYYNAQYLVRFNPENGLLMQNDKIFDTQDEHYMFVVSPDGDIYTRKEIKTGKSSIEFPFQNQFGHPSFGFPTVKSAGEWNVKNGIIVELNNDTGHYSKCTAQFFAPNVVDMNIWDFAESYCHTAYNENRQFILKVHLAKTISGLFYLRNNPPLNKTFFESYEIDCAVFH